MYMHIIKGMYTCKKFANTLYFYKSNVSLFGWQLISYIASKLIYNFYNVQDYNEREPLWNG